MHSLGQAYTPVTRGLPVAWAWGRWTSLVHGSRGGRLIINESPRCWLVALALGSAS